MLLLDELRDLQLKHLTLVRNVINVEHLGIQVFLELVFLSEKGLDLNLELLLLDLDSIHLSFELLVFLVDPFLSRIAFSLQGLHLLKFSL